MLSNDATVFFLVIKGHQAQRVPYRSDTKHAYR
jgi:hypothetical protein